MVSIRFSEAEAALHAHGFVFQCGWVVVASCLVVDEGGFHLHAQVGADVEIGQFGVHISIDHGYQIDADEGEDTQVAPTAIGVLALTQGFCDLRVRYAVDVARR